MTEINSFGSRKVGDLIKSDTEYFNDMLVRSVYNSASIEGNRVSVDETRTYLIDGIVPRFNKVISPRELYELDNLREAWTYMLDNYENQLIISSLHQLHYLVMDRATYGAVGEFKRTQNMVGGELTTSPAMVYSEIYGLLDSLYNSWLVYSKTSEDLIRSVAEFHIRYEKIHPYEDGNGRTGRCLMSMVLMYLGFPPVVIEVVDRTDYIGWIRTFDIRSLAQYLHKAIEKERILLNRNGTVI